VDSFDLDQLSSIEHAHVPFVVILLQALTRWKKDHNGVLPSNFNEKMAFKDFIQSLSIGPPGKEQNFVEATEQAYKAYSVPIIPEEVRIVLEFARNIVLTETMNQDTFVFWILAKALVQFMDLNEGLLPVTGIVPDMIASTETYVALQQLYMDKAQQDAFQVETFVKALLKEFSSKSDHQLITSEQIVTFCKNVYNIGIFQARPLYEEFLHPQELDLSQVDFEEIEMTTKDQTPLIWYFCIRSAWAFGQIFQRWPGSIENLFEKDIEWIYQKSIELATFSKVPHPTKWIQLDHAKEICRYCEVELHNIAALMGGIASQEAIKLITHQFIPLHHTYLFNGQAASYAF
jgi:amyloid beta precursor protein binding protein 1